MFQQCIRGKGLESARKLGSLEGFPGQFTRFHAGLASEVLQLPHFCLNKPHARSMHQVSLGPVVTQDLQRLVFLNTRNSIAFCCVTPDHYRRNASIPRPPEKCAIGKTNHPTSDIDFGS